MIDVPEPLGIGVIGCADIAWRRTIPSLLAHPGVRLAAVASRDGAKAARFAAEFGCAAVTGYERLLADDGIQAVYIPLPAMLHAEWVERALLAGKHVLAEKPLTASHFQTAEMTGLARASGLVLLENMMFLRHSQHRRAAELIAGGEIGDLRGFTSTFTIPPKPAGDIRYQPETGGGALLDIGCYPVRAAMYFLGPDLTVDGSVLRYDRARNVVVSGAVLLTNAQGLTAQLDFGMDHSYRSGYEIAGSTGRLAVDRAFTPPPDHHAVIRVRRQDSVYDVTLPAEDQFLAMVDLFVQAVHDARDAPEVPDGITGDVTGDVTGDGVGDGTADLASMVDETVQHAWLLEQIAGRAHAVFTDPVRAPGTAGPGR